MNIDHQLVLVQNNCSALFLLCLCGTGIQSFIGTEKWSFSTLIHQSVSPCWHIYYQYICMEVCMQKKAWQKEGTEGCVVGGCIFMLSHLIRPGVVLRGKGAIHGPLSARRERCLEDAPPRIIRSASSNLRPNPNELLLPSKVKLRPSRVKTCWDRTEGTTGQRGREAERRGAFPVAICRVFCEDSLVTIKNR